MRIGWASVFCRPHPCHRIFTRQTYSGWRSLIAARNGRSVAAIVVVWNGLPHYGVDAHSSESALHQLGQYADAVLLREGPSGFLDALPRHNRGGIPIVVAW